MLLTNKKEQTIETIGTCNNMAESQNNHVVWKRSPQKEFILHDSTYIQL